MNRYYQTSIKEINSVIVPNPEPENWLGYRYKDRYYIKSDERIDGKELDGEEIRECPIDTNFLKDQFI